MRSRSPLSCALPGTDGAGAVRPALRQQDELERADRQHCRNLIEPTGPTIQQHDEAALQTACEELATELLHVRMAVIGTAEELALHEASRPALPLVAAS